MDKNTVDIKKSQKTNYMFFGLIILIAIWTVVIFALWGVKFFAGDNGGEYSKLYTSDGKVTVCIDAGHGHSDPGAVSDNLGDKYEKDINLDIALKLQKILEDRGYEVIMTRSDDVIPEDKEEPYKLTLEERVAISDSSGADLFVSIHCNSYSDENVRGIRIYYCGSGSEYTHAFAQSVSAFADECSAEGSRTYSMDAADAFYVVKHTTAPSILVESGFITNKSDAELLLSETWQSDFAEAIADGITVFAPISDGKN